MQNRMWVVEDGDVNMRKEGAGGEVRGIFDHLRVRLDLIRSAVRCNGHVLNFTARNTSTKRTHHNSLEEGHEV